MFVQSTYNIHIPVFINKGVKEKKDDSEQLKVSVQQLAQAPLTGENENLQGKNWDNYDNFPKTNTEL